MGTWDVLQKSQEPRKESVIEGGEPFIVLGFWSLDDQRHSKTKLYFRRTKRKGAASDLVKSLLLVGSL